MAIASVRSTTSVRVSLALPEGVYDQYAERAAKRGVDVMDELLTHLTRTRNWTDSTPIYLDNSARNALSKIADKTLHSQQDVLDWARQSSTLTINGVKVELSSPLRAKIDVQRYKTPFKEFLPSKVIELLEQWLNLR
jgi:hypothetical protein